MHSNITFTQHALRRAQEIDVDSEDLIRSRQNWKKCQDSIWRLMYKLDKYGQGQLGIEYWYSEKHKVLLTLKEQDDTFTCITVTRKNKKEVRFAKRK